jgi:hypothetical protein
VLPAQLFFPQVLYLHNDHPQIAVSALFAYTLQNGVGVGVRIFSKMGFGSCEAEIANGTETKDIIDLEADFGSFLCSVSHLHLLRLRSHRVGTNEPTRRSDELLVLRSSHI